MRLTRGKMTITFLLLGVVFIAVLSAVLPIEPTNSNSMASVLLDKTCATLPSNADCQAHIASGQEVVRSVFSYPVTFQTVMWMFFFYGLGEVAFRLQESRVTRRYLSESYAPTEADAVIQPEDASAVWIRARDAARDEAAILPRLLFAIANQFQTSRSINQTNTLLNSQLDLMGHAIDVKYSMIRFTMWMLPTLGFMGTVYGLMMSLGVVTTVAPEDFATEAVTLFPAMIEGLSVAFATTLVGLMQAAVLVWLMHYVQEREEEALNKSGQHCLEHFISKLYVKT